MRRLLTFIVCFLVVALLVLPTAMGRFFASAPAPLEPDGVDSLTIKIWFPEQQELRELPLGEYLLGVVAAEMPPEFATEALKAQFIVARTYAVRRMQPFAGPGKGGCPQNPQADVCADHRVSQAYMTQEEAIAKFGRPVAQSYWKRLEQARAATEGLVLWYGDELIDPLYHSVSGRLTEDSGDYFMQSLPYLKPVDDSWGAYSPKLMDTQEFSLADLVRALSSGGTAIPVSTVAGSSQPVQIISRTATGRVKQVKVGGVTLTGREFRERLGLRSSDFRITYQDGKVIVNTHGYGHGVGMSQYGANGMAMAGHTYREILTHYYTGISIAPLFRD